MNYLVATPNVSAACPAGYCELHPLADLPSFVKCWPEPAAGCASLVPTSPAFIGPVQPIPSLSEWAVMVLVAALALAGAWRCR